MQKGVDRVADALDHTYLKTIADRLPENIHDRRLWLSMDLKQLKK